MSPACLSTSMLCEHFPLHRHHVSYSWKSGGGSGVWSRSWSSWSGAWMESR